MEKLAAATMAVLTCAFWPAGPVSAAEPPATIAAAVESAVRPLLAQYDVPGLSVAVTVRGQHFFFNYGVASKSDGKPVTENTLFEIGSLSKTFTATLIGYAAATEAITLDDHPSRFIPALRGAAVDKAALLNLATFTAGGLPLQFPDAVGTDAEAAGFFQHWVPRATPDTVRQYSNPSIGLAGHLAALSMHRDFRDLMESDIFPRLRLAHSYIRVPPSAMDNYAWGTSADGKAIRVNPGAFDAEAYGVKSTSADMISFVDDNIAPDTLEGPIRQAVTRTHVGYFETDTAMAQGLGWEQYPYPVTLEQLLAGNATSIIMQPNPVTALTPPREPLQPTLFNKTGSTNGFGAYAVFVPAQRIGLVMLANRNFPIPARVAAAYAVLQALAADAP